MAALARHVDQARPERREATPARGCGPGRAEYPGSAVSAPVEARARGGTRSVGIDEDAQRPPQHAIAAARAELGIVGERGARADHHGVGLRAQPMHERARGLAA